MSIAQAISDYGFPIVATVGFNVIPFKAYIIVSALSALTVATLLTLTKIKKKNLTRQIIFLFPQ